MASSAAAAAATAVVKAPPQGGVLEGGNPVHFDAKNPIILFIVQVCWVWSDRWASGALNIRTRFFGIGLLMGSTS
jgi:hypothetical protein